MIQIFKNVENKELKQNFGVDIQFHKDSFLLSILDKNNAWQANISRNDITGLADTCGISVDEYFPKLKTYLLETPKNVEFRFKNSEFSCYYKAVNGMDLKYFSTKLQKVNHNQIVYDLLNSYSIQNQELRQEHESNIKERNDLKEANIKFENKLTELVDRKLKDEADLYSNFVLVLNEKKRRIQHLDQMLHAFKAGRPVLNPQVKRKLKPKKEVKKVLSEVSESDSGSAVDGYNTDEEKSVNEIKENENVLPNAPKEQNINSIFDELDTPVLHNLPKRIKINNEHNEIVTNVASTSNIRSEIPKNEVIVKEKEENSSEFDNTQDLLDCI